MPVTPRLINRGAPGTYVNEDTYGAIPASLNSHDAVYVLGTCSNTSFQVNTPTYFSNYDEYIQRVGSSPSAAAIKSFFAQRCGLGLWFTRVAPRQQSTLTVSTFTAGTTLTVTYNAIPISYVCVAGETALTAADGIGSAVAQQLAGVVSYYRSGSNAVVRFPVGATLTGNANLTIGAAATGGTPQPYDVADCLRQSFTPEYEQGYLCAPEFYQAYATQALRNVLQLELEAFCSDPRYYWVALVDCSAAAGTDSQTLVNSLLTERSNYVSVRGNSWMVAPYLRDSANVLIPPSLAVVGVALRRARAEGFIQPPAGVTYPLYGIARQEVPISQEQQEQLNPKGINCIRTLPARGIVAYGARTLATSSFYRFAATRVILNVLAGTLSRAYDAVVFSLVDGQGALFARVRQTAENLCEQLRLAGGLYGATADEAYLVVCDSTNNPLTQLEAGTVYLDVVVKPSPTMEVLNITLSRAALSTVFTEVAASGDTAPVS